MNEYETGPGPLPETLDLRAYLRPVWRWKWVIVLVVAVAAAGTYLLESRQAKRYVSSTSVLITDADPAAAVDSPEPITPPTPQQMVDLATVFTDQPITATVYKDLKLPLGSAGTVSVAPEVGSGATESSILVVTATSRSPSLAASLANTYVSVFRTSQSNAQAAQATSDLAATRQALTTLANTSANATQRQQLITQESVLRTQILNPSSGATPIDTALAPKGPSSPRPARDALLGGLVGLLLGIGLAFALELFDRRLRQVSSIESTYNMPVLAVLPHVRNPTPMRDGRPAVPQVFLESMRSLRLNVGMVRAGAAPRTMLVTSAIPGEGKSTVARDLALVYAEAGESVLLIDADLRRPSMSKLFGVGRSAGLAKVLRRDADLAEAAVLVSSPEPPEPASNGHRPAVVDRPRRPGTIHLLDHGESVANPVSVLGSKEMTAFLAAASRRFDIVIVDSAPLLAVADTVPLLEHVDAVLIVARLGLSTRDSADRLKALLERVPGANIAGVVTNDLHSGGFRGEKYSYYGYGPKAEPPTDRAELYRSVLDADELTRE